MFSVNEFSFMIKPAKPQFCQNIVCVQRISTHSFLLEVSGVGFIWGESILTETLLQQKSENEIQMTGVINVIVPVFDK